MAPASCLNQLFHTNLLIDCFLKVNFLVSALCTKDSSSDQYFPLSTIYEYFKAMCLNKGYGRGEEVFWRAEMMCVSV